MKHAELRWNDRDYRAGDVLILRRTVPGVDGPEVVDDDPQLVRITHVLLGGQYGLAEGWAMLSIERVILSMVRQ